ncbi:MAG: peptidoglycan-associated lipoprotein Pal [Rhodospirillaceae bacterium]
MYSKLLSLLAVTVLVAACADNPDKAGATTGAGLGNTGTSNSGIGTGRNGAIQPGSQEDLASIDGQGTGDRVFFQSDRSDLTPEARSTLDRQAAWLNRYSQVTVTIEGHCDERGTREYNIGLGNRRATAVRNYLTALGIGSGRVAIISYGKEKPIAVGGGDESWSQNRRGVTIVN